MTRERRFISSPEGSRLPLHGPVTDAQLRAYLAARETMRQLKAAVGAGAGRPCFARNWRPQPPAANSSDRTPSPE